MRSHVTWYLISKGDLNADKYRPSQDSATRAISTSGGHPTPPALVEKSYCGYQELDDDIIKFGRNLLHSGRIEKSLV